MRTLANILWHFPFMGFISAFWTLITGLFFLLTVVGAPIGLGLIQHSRFLLTPFSCVMVSKRDLNVKQNPLWQAYGLIIRIIYFPFGLVLAVVTLVQIIGLCISIIGIPVAIVLAKSLSTYFNPVNKVCVSRVEATEAELQRARMRYGRR